MGKKLPGITLAFENPKGGVGKSTLTALFAGYVHSMGEDGINIGVVDIDDMQNTMGRLRQSESDESNNLKEEYEVMNISSSEFINQLDMLKQSFDVILVDFPGNLKQNGVIEALHFIDIVIMPFEPNNTDLSATLYFYDNVYKNIIKARKENGLKTTVRGVMNRVMTNVIEFKELVSKKENLPFQLMESFIKDSRVDYQRNLSTLSSNYHHPCDQFCEEVIFLYTLS